MPKVSIITASYNYGNYISEAIKSVINQSFKNWEMIVIDDGSKDNSIDVINEYVSKDNRIKLLTHQNNENKGLIETLKFGISQAQGEYIVFLESDDYISNDYIEKKIEIFSKDKSIGLVYNKVKMFDSIPLPKYINWIKRIDRYWQKHNYAHNIHPFFALENYIPTFSCVMLKKELLQGINWNSPNPAWIDIWLWIQISKKCNIYCYPEELTFWRIHNDSYINKAIKNPEYGYSFYKKLLCSKIIEIKSKRILILFYISKLLRLLMYKYWCITKLRSQKGVYYE